MFELRRTFWVVLAVLGLVSCHNGRTEEAGESESDSLALDSVPSDTMSLEEEEIQEAEATAHFDNSFDDFLYIFLRSRRIQQQRIKSPLYAIDQYGDSTRLKGVNWRNELSFLEDDNSTVLFGNSSQIEALKEDTSDLGCVDRIDLDNLLVTSYQFSREQGKWMLQSVNTQTFDQTEMSDFLHFYTTFSSDSLYRRQCIAQPLSLIMEDPEEDSGYMAGTIDAEQFETFCPQVPSGIISNIRHGQDYSNPRHMVMQRCGVSNGMQEFFTFDKQGAHWYLTSYED